MPRIVDFDCFRVPPRWLFVRLETDDGLVGWGECTLEGRNGTVETDVRRLLEHYLLGADPAPIATHWQRMYASYHNHLGPVLSSAIGGIDQALWDLKGKRHGVPVYELLGGASRDRVLLYHHSNVDEVTPESVETLLEPILEEGFRAIKTSGGDDLFEHVETPGAVEELADRLEKYRSTVEDEVAIGVDFSGRCSRSGWRKFAAVLEDVDAMFMEEPVRPAYAPDLDADSVDVPIAAGERVYRVEGFRRMLEAGAIDVAQPDPVRAGGITGCRRVSEIAGTYDVPLVPNCSVGPIAMAACYNLNRATTNAVMMPYAIQDSEHGYEYVENPSYFEANDGFLDADGGPGLGVDVSEERVVELSNATLEWQPFDRWRDDGTPIA